MKISVIIPTYNRGRYIEETLRSIFAQRKCKWDYEVIVVDDGSTDDTETVVRKFKQVKYYKIKHSGRPAVPRNFGIAKAAGELIAFQDSDDLWTNNKLASQVPLFDDPQTMFSFANANVMTKNGETTTDTVVTSQQLLSGLTFKSLLKANVVSTLTVMVRKSALETVGIFNESTGLRAVEDYELWLRLLAKFPKGAACVDRPLAVYRQHASNISSADALTAVERLLNVCNSLWEIALASSQRSALERALFTLHENWSRLMNESGKTVSVSVVMSVYNSEAFLRPAIESILAQTYKNFEFIIIDDGSSDNSVAIIKSYKDPRIRLIRQTNHRLVYALNQGVKAARGEFIARQDADDISLPSRFKKEQAWLNADDRRGLVSAYFTYINEKDSKPSITLTFPTKHVDLVRNLYYTNPFAHSAAMIRRSAIATEGYYRPDYDHNEDYDLWRRIANHWEVGLLPEVLLKYRINPNSLSHTNQDSQHAAGARIIAELWQEPAVFKSYKDIVADAKFYNTFDRSYNPTILQQYTGQQAQLAIDFLKHGQLQAGFHSALAALRLQPRSITRLIRPMTFALPKRILKGHS